MTRWGEGGQRTICGVTSFVNAPITTKNQIGADGLIDRTLTPRHRATGSVLGGGV